MSVPYEPAAGLVPPVRMRRNGIALAAMVLGIIAVVLAVLPLASYGAGFIGIVALILGIIALVRARAGRAPRGGLAGVVLGAVAIVLSIALSVVYTLVFYALGQDDGKTYDTGRPIPAGYHAIRYRLTGTDGAADIQFSDFRDGREGVQNAYTPGTPWQKTIAVDDDVFGANTYGVQARLHGDGVISCQITIDGKVVSTHRSTGPQTVVACSSTDR